MGEDTVTVKGGSVTIEHSSKFGDDPNGGRKSHTHDKATLKELKINNKTVQSLNKTDKIEIVYTEP